MIVVTGAAGFIGSCLISRLNADFFNVIIAVDDFSNPMKNKNLENKTIKQKVERKQFADWLDTNYEEVEFIFHIGARTDTTEKDESIFAELNLEYSKMIWKKCCDYHIPLIYASSAATYGMGEHGFEDDESLPPKLKPLNPYGHSKNEFDKWALDQREKPFYWAGLKFFNVFGPNEYHKGRMASVILHAFKQIKETGKMNLFRSHHSDFKDGEQKRDFIYVKDLLEVCIFLMHHRKDSGIYNIGTGKARTFLDLTRCIFLAIQAEPDIQFIETPIDIRNTYQYFTEAKMNKLRKIGFNAPFMTLEEAVQDYINEYLGKNLYF